jgi:cytochrome c oxidase subunit III
MRDTRLYGMIFFFVLVHAAHVLGGMIYLAIVTHRALDGRYDHENYVGVKHAAMYWHFLDVVWLLMFGTFLFAG